VIINFTRFKQKLEESANFSKMPHFKLHENQLSFSRGAACEPLDEANYAFVQIAIAKALNSPSVLPREHRV
jgi:hypothetical protein